MYLQIKPILFVWLFCITKPTLGCKLDKKSNWSLTFSFSEIKHLKIFHLYLQPQGIYHTFIHISKFMNNESIYVQDLV